MRQLAAVDALSFSEQDYYDLIRNKTASLIAGACSAGSLCGAPEYKDALTRYGDRIGMAFQIADDILDYTGDESVTGKPGGHDLAEHKVTLPLIGALPALSRGARTRVEELFACENPAEELISEVIGIVADAGGIEYARMRGEELAHDAEQALSVLPAGDVRTALTDAIAYVMERRS
jgi:octaprenyl-diphosphate synthase